MFDWIGSYELLFILILAGIVMGPKRIAQFARWLGQTTAYLQNISRGFANQLKNELEAIDGDGDMQDMLKEMRSLQKEVSTLRQQVSETATAAVTQTKDAVDETKAVVENSIRPPSFSEPEDSKEEDSSEETDETAAKNKAASNGATPPAAVPAPPPTLPNLIDVPDDEE